MKSIIEVKNVKKKITLSPGVIWNILNDVDFNIDEGEFVCITGESASGKSTLIGMLLGFDKDFDGSIKIKDKSIKDMDEDVLQRFRRDNIGICYADKAPIILSDTIRENIIHKVQLQYNQDIELKVHEILSIFNLESIADKKVMKCGFDQLYVLMYAVAFSCFPSIVIADEFMDNLPIDMKNKLLEAITYLQKKNKTTLVIVSHDSETIKSADRVLNIMNNTMYEVDMKRFKQLEINSKSESDLL